MKKIILVSSFGVLYFLISVGSAQAGIFKCVNSKGTTVYHDKPCSLKEKETEMQAVKDPLNGYVPPTFIGNVATGDENNLNNNEGLTEGEAPKFKKGRSVSQLNQMEKGLNSNQGTNTVANSKAKKISSRSAGVDAQQASNGNGTTQASSKTQSERQLESEIASNPEKFTTH